MTHRTSPGEIISEQGNVFCHTSQPDGSSRYWFFCTFAQHKTLKVISHVHVLSYHACVESSKIFPRLALICSSIIFLRPHFYVERRKSIKSDLNAYSNEKIMNSSSFFFVLYARHMWSASKRIKEEKCFGNYVTWYENWKKNIWRKWDPLSFYFSIVSRGWIMIVCTSMSSGCFLFYETKITEF